RNDIALLQMTFAKLVPFQATAIYLTVFIDLRKFFVFLSPPSCTGLCAKTAHPNPKASIFQKR
ncbi:MAG TPA: hypothetical protein PLG66_21920, partial [Calditrichia bacterium]|nr:hypothetical protein [Calditrichia bacterium]